MQPWALKQGWFPFLMSTQEHLCVLSTVGYVYTLKLPFFYPDKQATMPMPNLNTKRALQNQPAKNTGEAPGSHKHSINSIQEDPFTQNQYFCSRIYYVTLKIHEC